MKVTKPKKFESLDTQSHENEACDDTESSTHLPSFLETCNEVHREAVDNNEPLRQNQIGQQQMEVGPQLKHLCSIVFLISKSGIARPSFLSQSPSGQNDQ